jgi:hypothetical protein
MPGGVTSYETTADIICNAGATANYTLNADTIHYTLYYGM